MDSIIISAREENFFFFSPLLPPLLPKTSFLYFSRKNNCILPSILFTMIFPFLLTKFLSPRYTHLLDLFCHIIARIYYPFFLLLSPIFHHRVLYFYVFTNTISFFSEKNRTFSTYHLLSAFAWARFFLFSAHIAPLTFERCVSASCYSCTACTITLFPLLLLLLLLHSLAFFSLFFSQLHVLLLSLVIMLMMMMILSFFHCYYLCNKR